jgi:hypothetical protein
MYKYGKKQKKIAKISVWVSIYAEFDAALDSSGKVAKNTT